MLPVSKAGVGVYSFLLILIAHYFGVDLDEGTATEIALSTGKVGSFILLIWGQLSRKDLSFGLFRKE